MHLAQRPPTGTVTFMKRHRSVLLLSVTIFVAAAAVPIGTTTGADRTADPEVPCTLESAKGSYGFVESETIIGLGPYASSGIIISDGQGGTKGVFAENAAGAVTLGITFAGTYTVNPDCTGSLTFTDNRGRTGHRAVAIVQDGKEIDYIFTDRGIPGTGFAKKQ